MIRVVSIIVPQALPVKTPPNSSGAKRTTVKKLSSQAIKQGLTTEFMGQHVVYYDSIGSTNEVARELAERGAVEGTLIVADEQTAGKGRRGRRWIAPRGTSLLASLILYPPLETSQIARLTMSSSLAAAHAIEEVTSLSVHFKWPNDILLGGKKAGGILVEAVHIGEALEHAVVGIGLNANLDITEIPEIADTATSISMELGGSVSRLELLQALLRHMESEYRLLVAGESPHDRWRQRLRLLGTQVQVATPWGDESGRAETVDANGALILRRDDGTTARITVGDVQ